MVVNRLPSLDIPPGALPNLRSYTGPMATVLAVLKGTGTGKCAGMGVGAGGCLRHLEVTDVDKKVSDFVGAFLPAVAAGTEGGFLVVGDGAGESRECKGKGKGKEQERDQGEPRGLWSLSVILRQWDNEILFAITQHFRQLRKIRVRYEMGYPSEVCLVFFFPFVFSIFFFFFWI